jgi:hypothetical protein
MEKLVGDSRTFEAGDNDGHYESYALEDMVSPQN